VKSFLLQVILTPNEDGRYTAEIPALPACVAHGGTREEAISNVKETARMYLKTLGEDNAGLAAQCMLSEVEVTV
jgi:predicted RNase H-like HicB family nuclease